MGKSAKLVDTLEGMAAFRAKYRILENLELPHYELGEWLVSKPLELVVIPMITFIKGGMEIPMGRVTRISLITLGFPLPSAFLTILGSSIA